MRLWTRFYGMYQKKKKIMINYTVLNTTCDENLQNKSPVLCNYSAVCNLDVEIQ